MKEKIKQFILSRLELRTKQFLASHRNVKLIVIAGSVGKTSTKLAVAHMLGQKYPVLVHEGNHNTELSVPLSIMNIPYPSNPRSLLQWYGVLSMAKRRARQPFPYGIIVAELGTDKPGDIAAFGRYLEADAAIVTAVSPEHMQFFTNLDAVAAEELSVAKFSKLIVINRDDIDSRYAQLLAGGIAIDTYGLSEAAEYRYLGESIAAEGQAQGTLVSPEYGELPVRLQAAGEQSIKPLVAAMLIGIKFGLTPAEIQKGAATTPTVPGRMQLLRGLENSLIIDDTYNSSPLAARAALHALYAVPHQHRIAILGSMNELGDHGRQAHEELGSACDPARLDWVVTIGGEAEKYLALAAAARGCLVRSFGSPYEAGAFVHSVLQPDTAILAKGSQNGVFAEEAVKVLLHSPELEEKLVRQSPAWMKVKQRAFSKF